MKTHDEIVDRCKEADHFFDFTQEVLLPYLPIEKAEPFLRDDADLLQWKEQLLIQDAIIDKMKDYMEFAWEKVQDHRGLSTSRSIEKMAAWLWLLGDEETLSFAESNENYAQYGAPILKRICEKYGFSVPIGEDIDNMAKGKPCSYGCKGCGA
jgi:hypothetical protein